MTDFDPSQVNGLNVEAFERWLAYKKGRKETYKDMSLHPLAMKFIRAGDHQKQADAVEHSIANNWSGFFPPDEKKPKFDPHAPKTRTPEQQKAADATFEAACRTNERHWKERIMENSLMGELELAEALLSRYEIETESEMRDQKIANLREVVGLRLRLVDAKEALLNRTVWSLVLRLFSTKDGTLGLNRLEQRARVQ